MIVIVFSFFSSAGNKKNEGFTVVKLYMGAFDCR